jgi:hypothetical protein
VIGFQNDVAAPAAIAAAGAAFGAILLARERHAAFAAVAGAGVDFDFVNEHRLNWIMEYWSDGVMEKNQPTFH